MVFLEISLKIKFKILIRKSHFFPFINIISPFGISWHNCLGLFYRDHYVIRTGAVCVESFIFWASVPRIFESAAHCISFGVVARITDTTVISVVPPMVVCTFFASMFAAFLCWSTPNSLRTALLRRCTRGFSAIVFETVSKSIFGGELRRAYHKIITDM